VRIAFNLVATLSPVKRIRFLVEILLGELGS